MATYPLNPVEQELIRSIEASARKRSSPRNNYIKIRPTQQCLLRIFKLLDSLKDQLKQLREKGELSAVDMGSIEKTKDELTVECSKLDELVSPGRLLKRRKKRCSRRSLTIPNAHVRDILADAERRTSQWLLDEKERVKRETEEAALKKAAQEQLKIKEKQKEELTKLSPYLDALSQVRQLRERANWKAGVGLPGAGEEEFTKDIEELKQSLLMRTSTDRDHSSCHLHDEQK